MLRMTSVTT